ncbi:hypothetical protein L3Q82_017662 [Scortum barcoo]|uniref:Uncharacterized protein n=1 Tax=Scortum barcoo TaxID=214431 RepID=A0ACB8VLT8_9TELE|nr:hypothetical protein L3Q82_017662 [Scortum barcoo]
MKASRPRCGIDASRPSFLGTHISENLSWTTNTSSLIKKAHQRLFFLRTLKKNHLSTAILGNFYRLAVRRDIRLKDTSPPRFRTVPALSHGGRLPPTATRGRPKPMQIDRTRLTPEERARRRQGNLCLYCGQAGHFVSLMPSKGTDSPVEGEVLVSRPL